MGEGPGNGKMSISRFASNRIVTPAAAGVQSAVGLDTGRRRYDEEVPTS